MIIYIFSLFFILLAIGILRNSKSSNKQQYTYSVIISCKNEEKNLIRLLKSLQKINYQKSAYEVIIADDFSTDKSWNILQNFKMENLIPIKVKEQNIDFHGKLNGLKTATAIAKNEILLFTDADCEVDENWLNSYNNYFDKSTAMIVGYSPEINQKSYRNFTQKVPALIFSSTIGLGFPFSCVGRNFALKRDVFSKIGGYEKIKGITSGDDKMMLNLVKKSGYKIKYNPDSPVKTFPVSSQKYIQQQKRRYGKLHQSSFGYKILSILIFLFYIYLPIKSITDIFPAIIYIISVWFLWSSFLYIHKEKFKLEEYLFVIIHPYWMIFYSIIGNFGKKWQWK
jgi:cellulose synthase/poly-beta-1,6-N-acetylglucosamine synthase-like glycosyltransferase